MCTSVCLVPVEVKERHWIFWRQNYRWLCVPMWLLGTEL